MAITRELPQERWEKELAAFSQRNTGRPVRLEVGVAPSEGEPLLAEHQPLLGIDYDPKGSEAPAIEVTVGAMAGRTARNLTHVIHHPTHVWVAEAPDGVSIGVSIASRAEGETRVLFEPEASLPK